MVQRKQRLIQPETEPMKPSEKSLIDSINSHKWYQTIPLSDGLSTPGETGDAEERKLQMMRLPQDLSGKTVLDIGCNEGFFSFDAERRRAKRVVAIDKSSEAREKFQLIKQLLNSQVEFLYADLLELAPDQLGKFDIVFFLSVFHHLRYPFQVLDRIFELTREYAIMEFVEAVPEEDLGQSVLVRKLSKKGHLHILPTRQFTIEMLTRAGYSKIAILGTHREHKVGPDRKMEGFRERRVLLKAIR